MLPDHCVYVCDGGGGGGGGFKGGSQGAEDERKLAWLCRQRREGKNSWRTKEHRQRQIWDMKVQCS